MTGTAGQPQLYGPAGAGRGAIPFRIFRKDGNVQDLPTSEPMIHLNILAQMLYEAFHHRMPVEPELEPIVVLFDDRPVDGLPGPGVYLADFSNELFRSADPDDPLILLEESGLSEPKSPMAIAYRKSENAGGDPGDLPEKSRALARSFSSILELHGNLSDSVQLVPELSGQPLVLMQWITEREASLL
ncbi:hypothetical protein [Edaphobacillus lindanitolerans]|uniref:Uncharacterized protein n=1 Tax=Edaphobacillus lindanitolerans TaxID=550447 RepID=A0A1U7PL13_9BACI|nr:hypothetical protein [Edaphobacillus lindanitolerans]SIT87201.1 hypothetical protein SAMN05428946_2006 [Edaphobacillus lindanitolerans]